MADVFLSYRNTPERRAIVRRLATVLRAYGVTVWWDYGLEAGESYRAQITNELASARIVAPLWCAESIQSPWVRMEAEFGKDKLLPARLQKVVPPDAFEAIQSADLIGWDGSVGSPRLQDFVRLVCKRLDRPATAPTDLIEELVELPPIKSLPEIASTPSTSAIATAVGPAHDYAFWGSEWEKLRTGTNLVALRAMAVEAPRYFADQARARIAEIEAAQPREVEDQGTIREAEERVQSRARQAEEWVRRHLEAEERERRAREEQIRFATEGRTKVDCPIRLAHGAPKGWFKPGAGRTEWFKDLDVGPEMVVVPVGEFTMGSNDNDHEKPPHRVTIKAPFAVGRYAVTFAEWDAAGLAHKPSDEGWGRGRRPVINVSWEDANAYVAWLYQKTGKEYRLLSEAEWEYCCRGGTTTRYAFGDNIASSQAQFSGGSTGSAQGTAEIGTFPPNGWGLCDMHGNVWEWCEDNWHGDYDGAPRDGSAWGGGTPTQPLDLRVSTANLTQELSLPLAQSIAQGRAAKRPLSAASAGSELANLAALVAASRPNPSFSEGLSSLPYSPPAQPAPASPDIVRGPTAAGSEGLRVAEPHNEKWDKNDLSLRVVRGGAWGNTNSDALRSAYRGRNPLDRSRNFIGFRVARTL